MEDVMRVFLAVGLFASACSVRDPLFCDPTHPCAAGQYCDTTGEYDPQHIRNSCVPSPFDAPPPADAAPGTLGIQVDAASAFVRVGSSNNVMVILSRGAGVDGAVDVSVASPPAGLTFDPLTIPSSSSVGSLVVHAAGNASFADVSVSVHAASGGATADMSFDLAVIGQAGTLDPEFGTGGVLTLSDTPWNTGMGMFAQGKNLVVVRGDKPNGHYGFQLTRLLDDGSIDQSFGTNGVTVFDPTTIGFPPTGTLQCGAGVQSSGKFVVAGSDGINTDLDPFVARFTVDGALDPAFTARRIDTSASNDYVQFVAVGPSDEIVLAGAKDTATNQDDALIIRMLSDGTPDVGFGSSGRVTFNKSPMDSALAVSVQPDGEILAAIDSTTVSPGTFLVRYKLQGLQDMSFGVNGIAALPGGSAAPILQPMGLTTGPAGLIRAWGTTGGNGTMAVWQLLLSGGADTSFGALGAYAASGSSTKPGDNVQALQVEPDGSLLAAGFWLQVTPTIAQENLLLHLSAAGVPDPSFGNNGVLREAIDFEPYFTVIRNDHRITVMGLSGIWTGTTIHVVLRRYWY
jgi:uncharacterized delta-60 repeat protein